MHQLQIQAVELQTDHSCLQTGLALVLPVSWLLSTPTSGQNGERGVSWRAASLLLLFESRRLPLRRCRTTIAVNLPTYVF